MPNSDLKKVVEVFLRKTSVKNVDEAVEKFCKVILLFFKIQKNFIRRYRKKPNWFGAQLSSRI